MLIVMPNPCLDITIHVPALVPGTVSRATGTVTTAGGKGVNVARSARALGAGSIRLAGLVPGDSARFPELLAAEGTELLPIDVPGTTRVATIMLEDSGRTTVINGRGPDLTADDLVRLLAVVRGALRPGEVLVCSGSLPPGLPVDAYGRLTQIAHDAGSPAVVDAAPAVLRAALPYRPDIVSPNLAEAEGLLFGRADERVDEVGDDIPARALSAAVALHEAGAGLAVVTAGAAGAAFVDGDGAKWVASPAIRLVNPIGAGDAFAGGAAMALAQGARGADVVLCGMAAGSASCEVELAGDLDPLRAAELLAGLRPVERERTDAT